MAHGHGWRIVRLDPEARSGEVAGAGMQLHFDASAVADEVLEVGAEVFVRLQSSSGPPHVARLWPCLARFDGDAPEGAAAPPASDERGTRGLLRDVHTPSIGLVGMNGDGPVTVLFGSASRNAYGIAGWDVGYYGALTCDRALASRTGAIRVAELRPADARERAWLHARRTLAPDDVTLALVERRDEHDPSAEARVVLVAARAITWTPPPAAERVRAISRALAYPMGVCSVRVEGRALVAISDDQLARPVLDFASEAEATAFDPWCRFVGALLGGDDVDWEL